jgi:hypothetical protein
VLTFYRERFGHPEREAFVVVQAQRLIVSKEDDGKLCCSLEGFFPPMGNIDCLSTEDGKADRYVLCWFDDKVEDFGEAFRRLTAVTFPEGVKFVTDERGKRTYNAVFVASHGKLE